MFTRQNQPAPPGSNKTANQTDYFEGSESVSPEVLEDYILGKEFGFIEKNGMGMVWKYGNPWLYPANEFKQLKTLVKADVYAQLNTLEKIQRQSSKKPEIPEAVKQKGMLREKEWHSRKAELNGPRRVSNL